MSGRRLGPYRLGEKLGSGGMGAVFVGEHAQLGARHAVKVMTVEHDSDALVRFLREGEVLAALDHPNVLRIHALDREGTTVYMAMDLHEGGDLARRLGAGPLPPRQAAQLVRDLARGLAYVHSRGVLHRDLKPANILFDEQGTPKLVDFGLASVASAGGLTRSGALLGTPAYMAPEQAFSATDADERSDVYGLGAVLYHCLTGHPPFEGALVNVLTRVVSEAPRAPRSLVGTIPPELEAICLWAMARQREQRTPSAAALAAELEDFLEGGATPPPPSGARWALLGAGLVLLVLALGLGSGLAWQGAGPAEVPPERDPGPRPGPEPGPVALANPSWERLEASASPRGRWGGAFAHDPARRELILVGGQRLQERRDGAWFDDVWRLRGRQWVPVEVDVPEFWGRSHAGLVFTESRQELFLFAGGGTNVTSQHWWWDGASWTQRIALNQPTDRTGHAMAWDPSIGRVVLFGGVNDRGQELDDTRIFDPQDESWGSVPPGDHPPARTLACLAFEPIQGRIVLFGGAAEDVVRDDLWSFSGGVWTAVARADLWPPARSGAALVRVGERLLLIGGAGATGEPLGDLWQLRGTRWKRLGTAPPLSEHSAAYDPEGQRVVLFGGKRADGTPSDELWVYYPAPR